MMVMEGPSSKRRTDEAYWHTSYFGPVADDTMYDARMVMEQDGTIWPELDTFVLETPDMSSSGRTLSIGSSDGTSMMRGKNKRGMLLPFTPKFASLSLLHCVA
jgi:hypothetical protein